MSAGAVDVARESARLEAASPEERLAFALETWGDRLLFTSSFGAGSGVLLHMWSRLAPGRPVVLVDTGFLFDETHAYVEALKQRLGLRVEVARPAVARDEFLRRHGPDVMARDPEGCCAQNKVEPLAPYLARAAAWVSGVRREQGDARGAAPILEPTEGGLVKVHPLATMTSAEAVAYMKATAVPEHPLRARRYLSVGCWPCTQPVAEGGAERSGRWPGQCKTECGLHTMHRTKAA
jgi:phosphoadenosine phosphosulfate reductase